jgi:hypothetical protein
MTSRKDNAVDKSCFTIAAIIFSASTKVELRAYSRMMIDPNPQSSYSTPMVGVRGLVSRRLETNASFSNELGKIERLAHGLRKWINMLPLF